MKICPYCDQPVSGNYCEGCRRFITPKEINTEAKINTGHDPGHDENCDYHATTSDFHQRYGSDAENYSYHEKEGAPFSGHDHDRVNPGYDSVNGSYSNGGYGDNYGSGYGGTSSGYGNYTNNTSGSYNAQPTATQYRSLNGQPTSTAKSLTAVVVVAVMIITIVVIFLAFGGRFGKGYEEYSDKSRETATEQVDTSLTADEYEALREALGYDEDGYKYVSHDEAIATGLNTEYWTHYDKSYDLYSERLEKYMNAEGIKIDQTYNDYVEDYYRLSKWGEEIRFFEVADEYQFAGKNQEGYIAVYGDSITNDGLCIIADTYKLSDAKKTARAMVHAIMDVKTFDNRVDDLFAKVKGEEGDVEVSVGKNTLRMFYGKTEDGTSYYTLYIYLTWLD